MRARWLFFTAALSVAALGAARDAHANGRYPSTGQVVIAPNDPSFLIMRTTFGLLFSHDAGKTWDWVCEAAMGYGASSEDPMFGITASATLLAATFEGLSVSSDQGCSWAMAATGADKQFADLAVLKSDPKTAVGLTSKYDGESDAGSSMFKTTLYATTNDGAAWALVGSALEPSLLAETVDYAPSDAQRIYVSGIHSVPMADGGTSATGILAVSKNGGTTWDEHEIAFASNSDRAPYIAAVDPKNADRLYVRIKTVKSDRLLVSDDGGATTRTIFTATQSLDGFALSPDGSKVYVGGKADGLWVAASTDLKFSQVSQIHVQCLATAGATLYACSDEPSGFALGSSADDGKTFAALLHIPCVRGALACGPSASAGQCSYPNLVQASPPVGAGGAVCTGAGLDAGTDDGGSTGGESSGGGTPASKSCGCATIGAEPASYAGALAIAGIAALFARKRKRKK